MKSKYRIDYFEFGILKRLILETELVFIYNDLISRNINVQEVLKIEKVLDPTEENTTDETELYGN